VARALGFVFAAAIVFGMMTIVLYGGSWVVNDFGPGAICKNRAEMLETEFKYGFFEGCFMKKDGKFVPYEAIRSIQ
jgi:hypothetical protein